MTTASDPLTYPASRKGRGDAAALLAGEVTRAPRTRLFPFYQRGILNRRTSWSTPRLVGPVVIKDVTIQFSTVSDPPTSTLELGTANIPVNENAVLMTVPRSWTVLTELLDPGALIAGIAGEGFANPTIPLASSHQNRALNLIITDPEFFLVFSFWNNNASTSSVSGVITLLEAVDPEALRSFL